MIDCRFGVSPVNYPDPDPDPEIIYQCLQVSLGNKMRVRTEDLKRETICGFLCVVVF